jgi:hypothetical protein
MTADPASPAVGSAEAVGFRSTYVRRRLRKR